MSVVATKIHKNKIVISADSIEVDEKERTQRKYKDAKLFEVNTMVIGGAGNCEEMDLFILFCKENKPKAATKDALLYFLADFHRWFDEMLNTKEESTALENVYIMVFRKKVFEIEGQYVIPTKEYTAIGAGKDYALSALYHGKTAEEAVDTACELSVWCERPINTIVIKK